MLDLYLYLHTLATVLVRATVLNQCFCVLYRVSGHDLEMVAVWCGVYCVYCWRRHGRGKAGSGGSPDPSKIWCWGQKLHLCCLSDRGQSNGNDHLSNFNTLGTMRACIHIQWGVLHLLKLPSLKCALVFSKYNYYFVLYLNKYIYHFHAGPFPLILH